MTNYNDSDIVSTKFPTDQGVIRTFIPLKNEVGNCLPNELHNLPPEIRPLIHSINARANVEKGIPFTSKGQQKKYNPTIAVRTIYVDTFHGIKIQAVDDLIDGWIIHTIAFNSGGVYNGHNGHVPNEDEFLHAASTLVELVKPLLRNPDDWIHILPGLHEHGRAWWKSIEIPFHVLDDGGTILSAFGGAKHPKINRPPLYKCQGESIAFSTSIGDLLIRIYRKDLEMRKKYRSMVTNDQPVLRIEVYLEGEKLRQYLPQGVWRLIDGEERLVGFRAHDLRTAHYAVMSKFDGAYTKVPDAKGENDHKLGRFMGWVSHATGMSFQQQFNYYSTRFQASNQPVSISNARSSYHIAARKELALLSQVSLTDLFSEDAWQYQPVVEASQLEAMTQARHRDIRILPEVEAAYGSTALTNG